VTSSRRPQITLIVRGAVMWERGTLRPMPDYGHDAASERSSPRELGARGTSSRCRRSGGAGPGASAGQLAGELALAIADCRARGEITQTA
jgi:hypothetical protein